MASNTLMINSNVHSKLKDIAAKRKEEGHPACTMASIVHELILKQYAKECKK